MRRALHQDVDLRPAALLRGLASPLRVVTVSGIDVLGEIQRGPGGPSLGWNVQAEWRGPSGRTTSGERNAHGEVDAEKGFTSGHMYATAAAHSRPSR